MVSLVYASSAVDDFSASDLVALLRQCCEKNVQLDISGMLLYKDGNFMQVLEGPDEAVGRLIQTIDADRRHKGIIRLEERQIEERQFSGWAMAFHNLRDPAVRELEGYSEFLNDRLDSEAFRSDASRAHRLLNVFRRSMHR